MATEKRLIDANAAVESLRRLGNRDYRRENGTIADAIKMLSHPTYTPTVDAVELVHGRWVKTYVMGGIERKYSRFMVKCSVCGWGNVCQYNFCPNCGAKMDGRSEGE